MYACQESSFSREEGVLGRVWAAGEPEWVPDVLQDASFSRKLGAVEAGLHTGLFFPILVKQEVVGIAEFFSQRVEHPDDKVWGMISAICSQIGQFLDRKQSETALADEREFLKAVLDTSQDGIVACDSTGRLSFVNHAARNSFGQSDPSRPAENWEAEFDLFRVDGETPLSREEIPLYRALRGEKLRDVEMVICPKGGTASTVVVTGQPITDAQGRPLGAVAAWHDVTERNQLEQQLRQAQKMEAFGQLAGGVAHDFNNLLTIIAGYSEFLIDALLPGDQNREMVQEIHKAGERAALLTRQLLAFSRRQVFQPEIIDANLVVASTEKMLGRLIGEDMNLTMVLCPGLDRVKVDPGQLEQVIMNLVVNSRNAMPEGGGITIETTNVDIDKSSGTGHGEIESGKYVLLSVSDTGLGMTDEVQRHVFEPFFTTKEPGRGTGLGLSIVFGIVEQSGGHIRLWSEVGRGTTFKIYLPAVEEAASPNSFPDKGAGALDGAETILLVEDEAAVRSVTRLALQTMGYNLLEASDGVDALRLCEEYAGPIHLLVSDVVMPRIGGRQLAE